jgi:hypothetical protein
LVHAYLLNYSAATHALTLPCKLFQWLVNVAELTNEVEEIIPVLAQDLHQVYRLVNPRT